MSKQIGFALTILFFLSVVPAGISSQTLQWSANFGGIYNDMGEAVLCASDSNIIILGSSYSYSNGLSDIYLIKTDPYGTFLWSAQYGSDSTDFGYDIQETSDNGFIIVGRTRMYGTRDIYLIKIDSTGTLLWEKTIGGSGDEDAHSVRETTDGGFIIGGTTNSSGAGYNDTYLVKTDSLGTIVWEHTYGGSGGETGYAARQTYDGGYILIGSTGSFGSGYSSVYVVRTDGNGDSLWATTYGGTSSDLGYAIEETADGGLVLVGATASFGAGESDVYLIKTDPSGNIEWENTFGGTSDDRGYAVRELASGNYVIIGKTESFSSNIEAYVIMTNPVGEEIWSTYQGGTKTDEAQALAIDINNDIIVAGKSYSFTTAGCDVYLFKLDGDQATGINDPIQLGLPDGFALDQNYPNPFNLTTTVEYSIPYRSHVTISIYNILGQVISYWENNSLAAGTYRHEWDGKTDTGNEVASGVYIYRLTMNTFAQTKKMVLLK